MSRPYRLHPSGCVHVLDDDWYTRVGRYGLPSFSLPASAMNACGVTRSHLPGVSVKSAQGEKLHARHLWGEGEVPNQTLVVLPTQSLYSTTVARTRTWRLD